MNGGDAFRLRLDLRDNLKKLHEVFYNFFCLFISSTSFYNRSFTFWLDISKDGGEKVEEKEVMRGEEKVEEKEMIKPLKYKYSKILILHGGELSSGIQFVLGQIIFNASTSMVHVFSFLFPFHLLLSDIAQDLLQKAESTNTNIFSKISLVKMDDTKAVKCLVDEPNSTLVIFICQTIENASPPEAAGKYLL